MRRVAAYCRVSTDKEDQANSFESQQHYFMNYIEKQVDWQLQKIYADEGLSGTSTKKRIAFRAMIQAAREGQLDLIVTKEVSRFSRNILDTIAYTRELKQLGVGVYFANDGINTMEPDAELRLSIMGSIAQEESRKTSDRVKWGQTRRMEQGVVFGRSLLGYDVKKGQIEINKEGANVVQLIFDQYINQRKGSGSIARALNEAGIASSRGNVRWSASTVVKILKNEKYCGDLIQKKTYTPDYLSHAKKYNNGQVEQVVLRDHHAPIIDRELWEIAQLELARRRTKHGSGVGHGNQYPLSGKIKCAECGSCFISRTKYRKGKTHYKIWRCGKAVREGRQHLDHHGQKIGCNIGRQLRQDLAIGILQQTVKSLPMDLTDMTNHIISTVEQAHQNDMESAKCRQRSLKEKLRTIAEKKHRSMDEFLSGSFNQADFQFVNQRYDCEISQLRDELDTMTCPQAQTSSGQLDLLREQIRATVIDQGVDDSFYGQLLDQMTVYSDGRVEVVLHSLQTRWIYQLNG